ncbi:hypothetical protein TU73_00340 [Pseudomonas libanensis]|uniref:Uncharacterized protein n=1 Tax=Pseudomonas libanensis TaxID=75588 RepID=A0A0R2YJQ4_9PSED|nr:hypothetical protein TU73_00340 [Pseudomonas libanensis]
MKKPQVERSGAFLFFFWGGLVGGEGGVELCRDCRERCWEGAERGFGLGGPGLPSSFRRENKSVPFFFLLADCLPRELSFKHSLQLFLAMRQYSCDEPDDRVQNLLKLIAKKRVGNRPGRIEPRAIKRRPKPYPMLMQTRSAARAEVRRKGHPKRVK